MARKLSSKFFHSSEFFPKNLRLSLPSLVLVIGSTILGVCAAGSNQAVAVDNQALLEQIRKQENLSPEQFSALQKVFSSSSSLGQGNPKSTQHPVTREECLDQVKKNNTVFQSPEQAKICKRANMVPLYNASTEKPDQAKTCIDQFEFPNIPCEYPVIWVRAREAAEICQAIGKRLCDAHEWEGGCAGSLEAPDYPWEATKNVPEAKAVAAMRAISNPKRGVTWAYGKTKNHGLCGTKSTKSDACNTALQKGGDVWSNCGSNTYPAGNFPDCHSSLGVYDQHGNAAEHMNIPVRPDQLASKGGMGHTEMKGSWFIFSKFSAHQDDCRWRAPYWHGSKVMDADSHANYHLGFRCCAEVSP